MITFTDTALNNGGFVLATDTTAAFSGSGASNIGGTTLTSADKITDFVSGTDVITFVGLADGSGSNYAEAAAFADFGAARTAADSAFNGTVQYYLTSISGGNGVLFFDANLDGNVDGVVELVGITAANFAATDIHA